MKQRYDDIVPGELVESNGAWARSTLKLNGPIIRLIGYLPASLPVIVVASYSHKVYVVSPHHMCWCHGKDMRS